jgi:molecular chaperone HtpG
VLNKVDVKIKDGLLEDILATAFAPVVALSELIKNSSDACVIKNDTIEIRIDTKLKIIKIKDNGHGFSKANIENFGNIGYSKKMINNNTLSEIGEPYAGSKGLGILMAFNLCNKCEILTYSKEDECSYKISWTKGAEVVSYELIKNTEGTEFILYDVSDETIILLTEKEELTKFYMSSINYYIDSDTLPSFEIYMDGAKNVLTPKVKIENLYQKFKKANDQRQGYFIAKATFKYSNNKLTLSYEDNAINIFNIKDEVIDLNDIHAINTFFKKYRIKAYRQNAYDLSEFKIETIVDDFEGVYYIWRETKNDEIGTYPCGVRIYINNYGLYDYLNKDYDWLQHSEITQNKKASNYKLKNTYGYVSFKNYNEHMSTLKISKERNTFNVTLSQKKFLRIMQNIISNIFSDIDINIKNYNENEKNIFEDKTKGKGKKITIGKSLKISDLIKTNIPMEEIIPSYDNNMLTIDENDNISFLKHGTHHISFAYNDQNIDINIIVEDKIPSFTLKKDVIIVDEGNTVNLRDEIKISSIKNLSIENINISSETATIKKGSIFSNKNRSGDYTIQYLYEQDGFEISKILKLTVNSLYFTEANKIKNLFTRCDKYPKINEIVDGIAECYTLHPTLSMIGIRPLIEISLKAFIVEFYDEKTKKLCSPKHFDPKGKMEHLFDSIYNNTLVDLDECILNKYREDLRDNRKKLVKYYENINPNIYIHNKHTQSTSKEVLQTMKQFQQLLTFIIEAINSKYPTS